MPRIARIVIPGIPHHVVQRGNNRQDVFFVDDDWVHYLALLKEESERFGVEVMGYCLMTNHIHVIATPFGEDALAKAVGRTHYRYTQYINRFHGRSGHLWQNRFDSCALDEGHFWSALRYVERNPVRARMVKGATAYRWSSADAHVTGADRSGLLDMAGWARHMEGGEWGELLRQRVEKEETATLRTCTHRGWPLGTNRFVAKFERMLGRRLRPSPLGRPRKKDKPVAKKRAKIKGKK